MMDKNLWNEGRQDVRSLAATIASGVLSGLCGAAMAWLLAQIVMRAYTGEASLYQLRWPLALLLAALLARAAASFAEERFSLRLAGGVQQRLRNNVLQKMEQLGPVWLQREKQGALLTLLTEGLDTLEVYFEKYLPQLFKSAVLPLVFLVLVFPQDWPTALVMIITAPLVPLFMWLIGSWTKKQTKKQWRVLAGMGAYFQDTLEGLSTLKLFGRTGGVRDEIEKVSEDFRKVNLKVLQWAFLSALVLELLTTISIALIAVGLGLRLVNGTLDFGIALFLLFLAPDFYLPLRSLGTQYHNSLNGAEAAKELYAFLQQPVPGRHNGSAQPSGKANLEITGLRFGYEEGGEVLHGISLSLQPGQKLGIVGPSGGGKTTLLHLLAGFLSPGEGQIVLGGVKTEEMSREALHSQIAMVPQDPYLFAGSVLDNIKMGDESASAAKVTELCKIIGADESIRTLPNGYHTKVGQGGIQLSGGQRQLVAIARACLKDAPLVLLDEATKNMDWQTDRLVQQALAYLTAGKTVVVVAHRLQTVQRMDSVVVLQQGRIAQQGPPGQLRAEQGPFAQLLAGEGAAVAGVQPAGALGTEPAAAAPGGQAPLPPTATAQNEGQKRGSMKTILRLAAPYKGVMAGASVLGAASIGANIALLGFSALLITKASFQPPILDLMQLIVAVRFFGIGRALLRYCERYVSHDATFRILKKLRLWYYDQMEKLSYLSLQRLGMGRVFKHIIGDVDVLKFFFLRVTMVPLVALLVLAGTAAVLGVYSPWLAVLLAAFFVVGGVLTPWLYRRAGRGKRRDYDGSKQRYSEQLYDYSHGLADEEIYGTGAQSRKRILQTGEELVAQRHRIGAWDSFAQVSCALYANLALFGALLVCVPLVQQGTLSGTMLATLVWVVWAAFEALQPVAASAEYLNQAKDAMAGMEQAAARPAEPRRTGSEKMPAGAGLQAHHLRFAYAEGPPVLQDISFALPPGGKLALVGKSGAGKTTLLNAVIGFLPVQRGMLTAGEVDFNDIQAAELRRNIGYLGQQPYLFHTSIRENLLLARPSAGEQHLQRALRLAQLDDFVAGLPDGLDTEVGENGYRLSAGQRQRMALARLILQDAPILILDEPTQSLDNQNRRQLLGALRGWWQHKTVLYITHDLYGLEEMDSILVLEGGRIAESGTQSELLSRGGAYAQLYQLQQDSF